MVFVYKIIHEVKWREREKESARERGFLTSKLPKYFGPPPLKRPKSD